MFSILSELLFSDPDGPQKGKMSEALMACKFQSSCNLTKEATKVEKGGKAVKIVHIGNIY